MQHHAEKLIKRHLLKKWIDRDYHSEEAEVGVGESTGEGTENVELPQEPVTQIQLVEGMDTDVVGVLEMIQVFSKGMAKQYMSKKLPDSCWGKEEKRRNWVSGDQSLMDSTTQSLALILRKHYRDNLDITEAELEEAKAVAAERARRAKEWLEKPQAHVRAASSSSSQELREPQEDNLEYPKDLFLDIVKEVVLTEVKTFLSRQLGPLVEDYLRNDLVPQVGGVLKDMVKNTLRKYWK